MKRLVHIVDDDSSVRRSTAVLLRVEGYTTESHASGVSFLSAHQNAEPGCVLLDIRMPDMDGLQVLARLRATGFPMPIVMMTAHGDISTAVGALRGGALNFIEKPFDRSTLSPALEDAFAHLEKTHQMEMSAARAETRLECLTPRERDVLDGLVAGKANKLIAIDLGISPRTVEIHRANLMGKLGVASLSDVLRIALVAGQGKV